MTRKRHNHTLQTNPQFPEEQTQNTNCQMTLKAARFFAKLETKQYKTWTNHTHPQNNEVVQNMDEPHPPTKQCWQQLTMNQQQQNRRLKMLSRSHWGPKLILLPHVRPRFCCCQTRNKMLSSRGGFLTYPMYHHGKTIKYINTLPGKKEKGSQLIVSQSQRKLPVELKTNIRR